MESEAYYRLLKESNELQLKIKPLTDFITNSDGKGVFNSLTEENKVLLRLQHYCMVAYGDILFRRLTINKK